MGSMINDFLKKITLGLFAKLILLLPVSLLIQVVLYFENFPIVKYHNDCLFILLNPIIGEKTPSIFFYSKNKKIKVQTREFELKWTFSLVIRGVVELQLALLKSFHSHYMKPKTDIFYLKLMRQVLVFYSAILTLINHELNLQILNILVCPLLIFFLVWSLLITVILMYYEAFFIFHSIKGHLYDKFLQLIIFSFALTKISFIYMFSWLILGMIEENTLKLISGLSLFIL